MARRKAPIPVTGVKRIILHWTANVAPLPTGYELRRYHFLITGEPVPRVVKGVDLWRNCPKSIGGYAQHVKLLNSGSIGVAFCGTGTTASSTIVETEWAVAAQLVADLCRTYNLAVSERTVLGHDEVYRVYGRYQDGRIDPFGGSLTRANAFRARVSALL